MITRCAVCGELSGQRVCETCAERYKQDPEEARKHHSGCPQYWAKGTVCECALIHTRHYG